MATVEVSASSPRSCAVQKCDLDTYCIRGLGDLMVRHSYEFNTKHSFTIDDRYGVTEPLSIVIPVATLMEDVPEKERRSRLLAPAILFAERLDLPVREVADWLGFLVDELDVVRTAFGGSGQEPDLDRMYVCFH